MTEYSSLQMVHSRHLTGLGGTEACNVTISEVSFSCLRRSQRRAERFDSTRQLDFFADLNLGPSDEEPDEVVEPVREGIAQYASMLSNPSPAASTSSRAHVASPSRTSHTTTDAMEISGVVDGLPASFGNGKRKPKNKRKNKGQAGKQTQAHTQAPPKKPSKWADKCMYAELLEMTEDLEMSDFDTESNDGIPDDLEGGWVAVTPVPSGKRCLAITHSAAGIAGVGASVLCMCACSSLTQHVLTSSSQHNSTLKGFGQIAHGSVPVAATSAYCR